ncbi:MAG: LacI family DNA-binding transcriptional regulator [Chloroflexota bacterium]
MDKQELKPEPKRRPSMNDVARLAGVSQTTVSFVINQRNTENIPQATQKKVWAAIEELGYRPNAMARSLRSSQSHTIGFVTDEVATSPYAGQIIRGAQEAAWDEQKLLLLVNTGGNQDIKSAAIDMLLERQVEGIIYAAGFHRAVSPPDNIREVPTVLLDCFVADHSLPAVVPDEVQGGKTATKVLIEQGHTRIGCINSSERVPAAIGRLQGYKDALSEQGLPFDSDLLVERVLWVPDDGYQATLDLMNRPNPPTAIFCFNDRTAMGAYRALAELGLNIPGDVAIMGYDNQETTAPWLTPPLSTMALPHYEMGQWAVQHLIQLIDQPEAVDIPNKQHMITCPFVKRDSV